MSPTRVLVQLNNLGLGGTQFNAIDLAWELRKHSYDSVLFGFADSLPNGPSVMEHARVRDLQIKVVERPQSTVAGARLLSELARQHRAELVHTYGTWSARNAYWGPCALGRLPLVTTVYEMTVASSVQRHTELVVGTGYLLDDLADRPGGVHLVSPPVDLAWDHPDPRAGEEFVRQHGLEPGHVRVVIVSRLAQEMKAATVEIAMQAVARAGRGDLDLVVVGSGDAASRLADTAERINRLVGRRAILMTGPMADPRSAYNAASVVIGMGGSAARALATGKPLVVSGEKGWFRAFTPQSAAPLFRNSFWSDEEEADPVQGLLNVLIAMIDEQHAWDELGRFGRSFAMDHFGLAAMGTRLAQVYQSASSRYGVRSWLRDLPADLGRMRAVDRLLLRDMAGADRREGTGQPTRAHGRAKNPNP